MATTNRLRRGPSLTAVPIRARAQQRGAIAIMFAMLLLIMLGFLGLVIDASRMFNRKVDLQVVADFVAMSAAQQLSGTSAGIDQALAAGAAAASVQKFGYGKSTITWSDSAIQFSSSPDSGWVSVASARAAAGDIKYVKVDTTDFGNSAGAVDMLFMNVLWPDFTSASIHASAVAGSSTINITPLAICAMSANPGSSRNGELVEYGFRRGVAYDLMQLNSSGTDAANFVINPINAGGGPSVPGNMVAGIVGPFVCAGSMPAVAGVGRTVAVSKPFPLGDLHIHLNSRFATYTGGLCDPRLAPPDQNIKTFKHDDSAAWMDTAPGRQNAQSLSDTVLNRLHTIADPQPASGTNTKEMYGQMWAYARPVPYSAYTEGVPEPSEGYPTYISADWPALYAPASPNPSATYPVATPYMTGGVFRLAPPSALAPWQRHRRVLNVALLDCPVTGSNATVVAIGRFFMTIPATPTSIGAEFAGIASGPSLRGSVELYK